MAMTGSVFQLQCSCNNYPWGEKGSESLAARLCAKTPGTDFKIENDKEYSGMRMGDYPELPAKSLETGEELHSIIDKNKEKLLGKRCIDKFGAVLPYLPKVLSIQKALPLQIHPNKELAAQLHKKDPEKFTDPNHKPEIAMALSKFEVFAGWKPLEDIHILFEQLEPLRRFLPDKVVAEPQEKSGVLDKDAYGRQSYILELLPRLQEQYSKEDAGTLVALLCMNFMVLSPGDAIDMPADGIHAYLSGDIVECMARSNNGLNTGFCPRADRDSVELFSNTMTFKPHNPQEALLPSKPSDRGKQGKTGVFAPPMSEFNMYVTNLDEGETEVLQAFDGPGVVIVTTGSGVMTAEGKEYKLDEGYVFYIAPGVEVRYQSHSKLAVYEAVV
ncbi:hypothetical protein MMC30_006065 [Trapelia coarctata]|nr:hypothetical protein [Trapelia coarctata]